MNLRLDLEAKETVLSVEIGIVCMWWVIFATGGSGGIGSEKNEALSGAK